MILPTKHISSSESLIGIGAELLQSLSRPQSVSRLWEKSSAKNCSFEKFVLALTFLHTIDLVVLESGLVRRVQN